MQQSLNRFIAFFLLLPLIVLCRPVGARPILKPLVERTRKKLTPIQSLSIDPNTQLCWPLLQHGSANSEVSTLQSLLTLRGYTMSPDGNFGFATETHVRQFQKAHNIQEDGIVGWQTWKALVPTLKSGSRGGSVRLLQGLLNSYGRGVPKVRVDGLYGAATQRAVARLRSSIKANAGAADATAWCHLVGGMFTPFE